MLSALSTERVCRNWLSSLLIQCAAGHLEHSSLVAGQPQADGGVGVAGQIPAQLDRELQKVSCQHAGTVTKTALAERDAKQRGMRRSSDPEGEGRACAALGSSPDAEPQAMGNESHPSRKTHRHRLPPATLTAGQAIAAACKAKRHWLYNQHQKVKKRPSASQREACVQSLACPGGPPQTVPAWRPPGVGDIAALLGQASAILEQCARAAGAVGGASPGHGALGGVVQTGQVDGASADHQRLGDDPAHRVLGVNILNWNTKPQSGIVIGRALKSRGLVIGAYL